jgi:predicted CXXCH cytochrome family protein
MNERVSANPGKIGRERFERQRQTRRIWTAVLWLSALGGVVVGGRFLWRKYARGTVAQAAASLERGDWSSAIRHGREALRDLPDDPETTRIVARASIHLGRDEAAIGTYKRLSERDMEPADFLGLGLSLARSGNLDDAKGAWSKGLAAGPDTAPLQEELAWILLRKHRFEEAIEVAEALGKQPGWEARSAMLLGNLRATLNDIPGSAEAFRLSLKLDPAGIDRSSNPVGLRKLIARIALKDDRPNEAIAMLLPILERGPDAEASWLLSRAHLRAGSLDEARESLTRAGSYRADHPLENDPGPYVGEARCEKCHSRIFRDSLANRHTQSYYRGNQLLDLPRPDRPLPDPDDPKVTHSVEERGSALIERTKVGNQIHDAVIEYAFGTSDRYLTTVNRDAQGDYRIARMSYYQTREGRGWDRSALDSIHPTEGTGFQGDPVGVRDGIIKCLYCHETNPRGGEHRVGPETADRAIGCERCHGPGGNHVLAVARGFPDPAIVNQSTASPAAVTVKQCNDCHILDRSFPESDPKHPSWIRSQGVGWTVSRCNTESGGMFGCVTCHDPHKPASATTTEQYEAKCVSCHAAGSSTGSSNEGRDKAVKGSKICPVNASKGCVGCHMPRTRIDSLHLDLSDHYIRVHRDLPKGAKTASPRSP